MNHSASGIRVTEGPRIGRCWFCAKPEVELTDEHVLAGSHFGATLVTRDSICGPCNSISGEIERLNVEHPYLGEAVARIRTGDAPKARPFPQSRGILDDGSEVQVERRPEGNRVVQLVPRQLEIDPDGTEVWAVARGTEREFEVRRSRRGQRVRAVGRDLEALTPRELHYGIGRHNIDAWGRLVAKVALAVASLSLPEAWLETDDAAKLRHYFLNLPRPGAGHDPFGLPLTAEEQDLARPPWSLVHPDHLLCLMPREGGGTRFVMALFGYLAAQVDLEQTDCPGEGTAWLLPSNRTAPSRLSSVELQAELESREPHQSAPGSQ